MERQKRSILINEKAINNVNSEKVRRRRGIEEEESCEEEVATLAVGCDTSDALEFRSQCAKSNVISGECQAKLRKYSKNAILI